ncbi:MAG TPA: hypothetical protein VNQ80_03690 [Parapedobacter sp.]|uniref:hypothetical protein n=1 Tax=Parapedobacter sp. TaxID=1958893 RepID=UPI002BEBC378|nr:hypothetical protein [Parapedobacter sp.]HWK56411.1 hypothetical protein [Parapedobacter sp.]
MEKRFPTVVGAIPLVLLVGLTVLVLYPMLFHGFSQRSDDDNWMLYENSFVRSLDWQTVRHYFTHFYNGQYSPINTLYYALIYRFFGLDPFWYHLFSLIFHMVNLILVHTFIQRLLSAHRSRSNSPLDVTKMRLIAFSTALLFAIHPVQVESVAWISASKNLLYTLFVLLALLSYLRYRPAGRVYWGLAMLFYVLAFGCKEQAVVLPVCLLLIDGYTGIALRRRRYWVSVLPFFVMALGMALVSLQAQESGFAAKLANEYYPFWQRLVLASYAFTEYLYKSLLPIWLNYWYAFPMEPGEALPSFYWFYPFVVACLGILAAFAWKRGWVTLLFGLGFLTVNLALALHIIPMARGVLIADRYLYLGGTGLFFALSYYVLRRDRLCVFRLAVDSRLVMGVYTLYLGVFAWRYAWAWS